MPIKGQLPLAQQGPQACQLLLLIPWEPHQPPKQGPLILQCCHQTTIDLVPMYLQTNTV